jgi:cytochrome c oxidase subunit 2
MTTQFLSFEIFAILNIISIQKFTAITIFIAASHTDFILFIRSYINVIGILYLVFIELLFLFWGHIFLIDFNIFLEMFVVICDGPQTFQFGTQDLGAENLEWLIQLHSNFIFESIFVLIVTIGLLTGNSNFTKKKPIFLSNSIFGHSKFLEIFWTVLPAFTLLIIASPTFNLLYGLDDLADPGLILKITAYQWYYSYEYVVNLENMVNFDAYLIKTEDLNFGSLRLLGTTERLVLPHSTHVRLLITSADILHSWTIPSLRIKIDACPGCLTQASIYIKRAGLYFGQCSEICGVNHGFIPISVLAKNPSSLPSELFLQPPVPIENLLTSRTKGGTFFDDVAIFVGISLSFIPGTLAIGPIITLGAIIHIIVESDVKLNIFSGSNVSSSYLYDSFASDNLYESSSESSYESSFSNKFSTNADEKTSHLNESSVSTIINNSKIGIGSIPDIASTCTELLPKNKTMSEMPKSKDVTILKVKSKDVPNLKAESKDVTILKVKSKDAPNLKAESNDVTILKTDYIPTGVDYLNRLTGKKEFEVGVSEFKDGILEDDVFKEEIRSVLIEIATDIKVFKELGMSMKSETPPQGFYISEDKLFFTDEKAETKIDNVVLDVDKPDILDFPQRFGDLFPESCSNLESNVTKEVLIELVDRVAMSLDLEKSMVNNIISQEKSIPISSESCSNLESNVTKEVLIELVDRVAMSLDLEKSMVNNIISQEKSIPVALDLDKK